MLYTPEGRFGARRLLYINRSFCYIGDRGLFYRAILLLPQRVLLTSVPALSILTIQCVIVGVSAVSRYVSFSNGFRKTVSKNWVEMVKKKSLIN